ncbi:MAG: AMP-binding protein [Myxococcota bacterium]
MKRVVLGREIVADDMSSLFDWRLARTPDRLFARFEDEGVSYRELDRRIGRIVAGFEAEGLEPGDRVATFMHNSLWHLALLFACARTGVLWAPQNVALKGEEIGDSLEELAPRRVFVDAELAPTLAGLGDARWRERSVVVDPDAGPGGGAAFEAWLPARASATRRPAAPGDPFCVMYSGGTTGRPKGVVLPHFCAVSCGYRMLEVVALGDDEVFYSSSHLYHALLPCAVIPLCMVRGYPVCFTRWWSASAFVDRVERYGATVVDPFIGMVATLLKTPETPRDRATKARVAISGFGGSEPRSLELRAQFERRFGIRTYQPYGQTEAGGFVTTESDRDEPRRGSSGKVQGWYDLRIVDADGYEVAQGELGEITVRPRAPGMMAHGYLGRAEETLRNWRDLWVHTGDEGYVDADGYLWFVGRKGHFLRRRGELVSVAEVESVLVAHPSVEEAVVVPVPSEMGEDDILCAVVWHGGEAADPTSLLTYCEARMAAFKVPRYVRVLGELPRTAAKGEVDRPLLKRLGVEGCFDRGDGRLARS